MLELSLRPLARVPGLRTIRDLSILLADGVEDTWRFAAHSGMRIRPSHRTLEARIIMEYHRIEKGLTLRQRRPWFGEATVLSLLSLLERRAGLDLGPSDEHVVPAAIGALRAYFSAFAEASRPAWVPDAESRLRSLAAREAVPLDAGGVQAYSAQAAGTTIGAEFPRFVRARHSIRHFSPEPVAEDTIEAAVALAATSPSVCNRQPTRVRRYRDTEEKRAILAHQNGNRGFGDEASEILLVTTDLESFVTPGERSQGLIDGGMFCMTLVYALHAAGVGTCCLNWSASSRRDRRLRRAAKIDPWERVIMLIAVGYPAEQSYVATSAPTPTSRVLIGEVR